MILTTTETIQGHRVSETLGLVNGAVTRATGAHQGLIAWIKSFFGGELEEYTKILAEAREQALDRMREQAVLMGADAIICVRFSSVEVSTSAAEFIVYGTAIRTERIQAEPNKKLSESSPNLLES